MLRLGVDVGGTNTDAALLRGAAVVATAKAPTTRDALDGIVAACSAALARGGVGALGAESEGCSSSRLSLHAVLQPPGLECSHTCKENPIQRIIQTPQPPATWRLSC